MGPSWGQVGAKLGPKTKRKEEEEEEEQEKKEEQENLQGFAGFARNLGPDQKKISPPTHWRGCPARMVGLNICKDLEDLQGLAMWFNHGLPLQGRRIQLRCAPSPPPRLGMFGWSAGGSVGSHASQLVNQRTSEEVNQSTNQLVSQSTNQKSTPKSTTSGPTWAQNRFKIAP